MKNKELNFLANKILKKSITIKEVYCTIWRGYTNVTVSEKNSINGRRTDDERTPPLSQYTISSI